MKLSPQNLNKTDRDLGNEKLTVFIILVHGVRRNEKNKTKQ